jgi:hypothetical protein
LNILPYVKGYRLKGRVLESLGLMQLQTKVGISARCLGLIEEMNKQDKYLERGLDFDKVIAACFEVNTKGLGLEGGFNFAEAELCLVNYLSLWEENDVGLKMAI